MEKMVDIAIRDCCSLQHHVPYDRLTCHLGIGQLYQQASEKGHLNPSCTLPRA